MGGVLSPGERRRRKRHGSKAAKAVSATPRYQPGRPDSALLLGAVCDALNACERAGITVKLAHGSVITEAGYVFPVGPDTAPWAVRTRMLTEFPVSGDED
jgi:hypothetical protein